jgi:hypothetical protein
LGGCGERGVVGVDGGKESEWEMVESGKMKTVVMRAISKAPSVRRNLN